MKVERSILLELWNIEICDIKFPNTVFVFQIWSTIWTHRYIKSSGKGIRSISETKWWGCGSIQQRGEWVRICYQHSPCTSQILWQIGVLFFLFSFQFLNNRTHEILLNSQMNIILSLFLGQTFYWERNSTFIEYTYLTCFGPFILLSGAGRS